MWHGFDYISVGEYTYGDIIPVGTLSTLKIGKFCSIGSNVTFDLGMQHQTNFISQFPFNQFVEGCAHLMGHPAVRGPIVLENDIWIGNNVTVMGGVHIGNGCIIGMNSIISKNVPDYTVVVGAPQKELRKRYYQEIIDKLLKLAWWDKPEDEIQKIAPLLMSNKVEELLKLYDL